VEKNESLFSALLQHRKFVQSLSPEKEQQRWGPLFSDARTYESSFHLPSGTLTEIVRKQKEKGSVIAADIMGYGTVLQSLPIDYGVAVALSKPLIPQSIDLITGTVASKTVWRELHAWLEAIPVENKKFTLILCRPAAINGILPSERNFYYFLLQQAYKLTSSDGGMILTQTPRDADGLLQEWIPLLKQNHIACTYEPVYLGLEEMGNNTGGVLTLEINSNSPVNLPPLYSTSKHFQS